MRRRNEGWIVKVATYLIAFLKEMEAVFPPPPRCHHGLMYAQYGSDEAGWSDRLMLQVNNDGTFYPFFLDDEDLSKSSTALAIEIAELLRQPSPKNEQLSFVPLQAGSAPAE
jgi:hypothetical protein